VQQLERCQDTGDGGEVWGNDRYTVVRRVQYPQEPGFPPLVWLSLHTHDREPLQDWRELQAIKNQLMGPEVEAVQLYPAESRLVDTANEIHLWGFGDDSFRWPFGFDSRLVAEGHYTTKAQQRPFAPGERPADCKTAAELEAMQKERAQ
jgi:hypothetical protein